MNISKALFACLILLTGLAGPAQADDPPPLEVYKSGKSLIFMVSDIVSAEIVTQMRNPDPELKLMFTPAMTKRIAEFTGALIGQRICGIFDGDVWFAGIKILESSEMDTVHFSGQSEVKLVKFISRFETLRSTDAANSTVLIEMFEIKDRIAVNPQDIVSVKSRSKGLQIDLSTTANKALAELSSDTGQANWRLVVNGRLAGKWRYTPAQEGGHLLVDHPDPALVNALNALPLKN